MTGVAVSLAADTSRSDIVDSPSIDWVRGATVCTEWHRTIELQLRIGDPPSGDLACLGHRHPAVVGG